MKVTVKRGGLAQCRLDGVGLDWDKLDWDKWPRAEGPQGGRERAGCLGVPVKG